MAAIGSLTLLSCRQDQYSINTETNSETNGLYGATASDRISFYTGLSSHAFPFIACGLHRSSTGCLRFLQSLGYP